MLLLGYHVIGLVFSSEKYQFDENTSGVDVVFYYKTHKIIDFFRRLGDMVLNRCEAYAS